MKSPFRGPEVRSVERHIGQNHTNQRDAWDIVPLGDHLRSDQHVELVRTPRPQQALKRAPALHRIAVQPGNTDLGQQMLQGILDLFCPDSTPVERGFLAARADRCAAPGKATVMTAQHLSLKMEGQADATVRARERLTAQAALQIIRIPAPIQK